MSLSERLLQVKDLRVYFDTDEGIVRALNGISFQINQSETLAVVGESGSGKSVTSLSIMQLIPRPPGRIVEGQILFCDENLIEKTESEMRRIRGNKIAMIFQEPMTSLNPVYTVGDQIAEAIVLHQKKSRRQAMRLAIEMLDLVGISEPSKRIKDYPYQMSGGMRQRVMIAIALSCRPKLLIADEPTSALDVTIQAQILDLIRNMQHEFDMSVLFITHDFGVAAEIAQTVVVIYAGYVMEKGPVDTIFGNPKHPYTLGLLNSIPRVDRIGKHQMVLEPIPGNVPNLLCLPEGCAFHPRCRYAIDECGDVNPELESAGDTHLVRCIRWRNLIVRK